MSIPPPIPVDSLRAGDLIAEIGATGRVTGPHLDWRMNLRERRIDPQLLVPPMPAATIWTAAGRLVAWVEPRGLAPMIEQAACAWLRRQ